MRLLAQAWQRETVLRLSKGPTARFMMQVVLLVLASEHENMAFYNANA